MLYIMRHGKTEWNKKKKLQGRTDIPLCQEGIEMAERHGRNIRTCILIFATVHRLSVQGKQPRYCSRAEMCR